MPEYSVWTVSLTSDALSLQGEMYLVPLTSFSTWLYSSLEARVAGGTHSYGCILEQLAGWTNEEWWHVIFSWPHRHHSMSLKKKKKKRRQRKWNISTYTDIFLHILALLDSLWGNFWISFRVNENWIGLTVNVTKSAGNSWQCNEVLVIVPGKQYVSKGPSWLGILHVGIKEIRRE